MIEVVHNRGGDEFPNIIEVLVTEESFAGFKEMVHRATNLWPDAPAEIKHFSDLVIHGHPMQDYFSNPHLAGKVSSNQSDKQY